MPDLSGNSPVCVVTGGTSGIGKATVQLFHQRGYRIATCGRNISQLAGLKEKWLNDDDLNFVSRVDLGDIEQTQKFAAGVMDKFGQVDVLVNNAATAPLVPFQDISENTFEETLNLNIRSVFYLTQKMWLGMMEKGRGVVVNVSSLAAVDPFPGFSIYGASKAWLDLMTHALAGEGEPHGIRVCSIRAGAVETPLLRKLFPDFPADQCVSAEAVAQSIFDCVCDTESHPSGQHFVVTNQS